MSSLKEMDTAEEDEPADTSPLSRVRNIGIVAHIDAGKTTTTERFLYYTGKTYKMGEVDDGTTATDFDEQEQERGITIFSAAVTCPWKDHVINLIDTPGHVDFTAEVERCLRVLDGAVLVFDAKEGVEAQSETVWRQARKYNVPCICLINKMDKIGADFFMSVASIEHRLEARPLPVQIPIGSESTCKGLIDLLKMKSYLFTGEQGQTVKEEPIPDALMEEAKKWRHHLEEKVAELDDALMGKYLEEKPLEEAEIRRALRRATVQCQLHPVFCGSALKHIGMQTLLDGVLDYLPSPLDRPPVRGVRSKSDSTEACRNPDPDEPLSALIFKIVPEKPLDLYYIRVYSGILRSNMRVFNNNTGKKENLSRLYRMFAKRREPIDRALPGDIVAGVGLKEALTGHTLCDIKQSILLEKIDFPTPVMSLSVEPKNTKDRESLSSALEKLVRQDPTFSHQFNKETGQTILSGMGELHLEVLSYRLEKDFRVPVNVGKPLVAYRETITQSAEADGRFILQTTAQRQFAVVTLRVEPFEPSADGESFQFTNLVTDCSVREEFIAAVRRGAGDCLQVGSLAGYEMINIRATLVRSEQDDKDSTELAFENAGRLAFEAAVKKASPVMLEPIMKLEVTIPEDYFGVVSGDLSARRGIIEETQVRHRDRVIVVRVPLAEMFGYSTKLRTLTQGRSSWSMEPLSYAPMPTDQQKDLLRRYGYID